MGTSFGIIEVHRRQVVRKALLLCLFFGFAKVHATAQQEMPYTLHVYTNLLQLPTLVLDENRRLMPPLSRDKFTLRLDAGPPFHPTQLRLEGDDPISLTLLLDAGTKEIDVLHRFDEALASLTPLSLTPRDKVNIFAFDCTVIRVAGTLQPYSEVLQKGVDNALAAPKLHQSESSKRNCSSSSHLWDAIGFAARDLATQPGRRVILVFSRGDDHGSVNTWRDIQTYASRHSIAVFGIRTYDDAITSTIVRPENPLNLLCSLTGGLTFSTSPKILSKTLEHFIQLLRARYIIEFPHPSNATVGSHLIDIKIPKKNAIILASGTTAFLLDEKTLTDPTTVNSDPALAPIQGSRETITRPR